MKTCGSSRLWLLVAVMAMLASGCGYTNENTYRSGIKTVHVPVWTRGKEVYRRELEIRLTEALQKRIELDTPYKVVSKDRADTELSGQIHRIQQRVLSKNPDTGRAREMEATFHCRFVWKDLRNGKVLVEHTNFCVADTYIPASPVSEDFFQGSESLINRLARRIVETMEKDW